MSKKTEGEVTIKLKVRSKGHRSARDFLAMIKDQWGVFDVLRKEIIEDDLRHSTIEAKVDQGARDLNILRKILKSSMPHSDSNGDAIHHKLSGDKGACRISLRVSTKPITAAYHGESMGTFNIDEGNKLCFELGYRDQHEFSMGDPKFLDNVREFIRARYDKMLEGNKTGRF